MKGTFDAEKMKRKLKRSMAEAGDAFFSEDWSRVQALLSLAQAQAYVVGMVEAGECEED